MSALGDLEGLLRQIAAAPRPTGSAAVQAARDACARELRRLGFEVREQRFIFSEFPGRLATPLMGASAAMFVGAAGLWGSAGYRWHPLAIVAGGAVLMLLMGWWLARRGVLAMALMRAAGVNLEATRPGETPRVWLCAHLDSKSQPVPTLARSGGIVVLGLGYAIMLGVALAAAIGGDPGPRWWVVSGALTLAGAIPVMLSMVGSRSPGALDNASGGVVALGAARALADVPGVGVLLTDAEELGLAGARAWALGHHADARGLVVLNCEGTDDRGTLTVMFTGRRPVRTLAAVRQASAATALATKVSRMVPGILADSVAFTDAGMESVTVLRGTLASLARVHRASDDLAHLTGAGIPDAITLVAATARALARPEVS